MEPTPSHPQPFTIRRRFAPRTGGATAARARLAAILLAGVLTATAVPSRAAVLVELFTAQGCSTCPPADRLLSAMGADPDLGKQVVPLAFHVDYWDTPAWRDRFSDPRWTQRQRAYVSGTKGARVYTPQMVVAGGTQCVGSDLPCIRAAVEAAAKAPQGSVELAVAPLRGDEVTVEIHASAPAGQPALDVMVILWESGLDTEVKGGENAKKTLHDDYVVRRLGRAFRLGSGGTRGGKETLRIDDGWRRDRLGIAVFLQDPKTLRVYGAAAAPVR
jgi:hypothetical protein